jgi:hypothetical protein
MHTIGNKAKIIISKELVSKVTSLHREVGDIEWSGALIYSVKEGSIEKPNELVIRAEDLHLMDVGTSAYTEYEFGPESMEIYDKFPRLNPLETKPEDLWRMGHIHTHHNMNCYFSGTDTDELRNNAPNYNYYLSLIVNYKGEYCAKIAISTEKEVTSKFTFKDSDMKQRALSTTHKEQDLMIIDFIVEFEDDGIAEEAIKIKKDKAKVKTPVHQVWDGWNDPAYLPKNPLPTSGAADKIDKRKKEVSIGIPGANKSISQLQVAKYLTALAALNSRTTDTLAYVLNHVDKLNDSDRAIWDDAIYENAYTMFYTLFPNTDLELEEIAEACIEKLDMLQVYNSATKLKDMFEEILMSYYELD